MNSTDPRTLFVVVPERPVDLRGALQALAATYVPEMEHALALLYSPDKCVFARVNQTGEPLDKSSNPVDLDRVFEARVFHDGGDVGDRACRRGAELRWLNDPRGQNHRAVVLSEAEPAIGGWRADPTDGVECVHSIVQHYLLWGESLAASSGNWVELATAQIGKLHVPCGDVAKAKQRVRLVTREYLNKYEHGNVAVFDERLVRLEVDDGRLP